MHAEVCRLFLPHPFTRQGGSCSDVVRCAGEKGSDGVVLTVVLTVLMTVLTGGVG